MGGSSGDLQQSSEMGWSGFACHREEEMQEHPYRLPLCFSPGCAPAEVAHPLLARRVCAVYGNTTGLPNRCSATR